MLTFFHWERTGHWLLGIAASAGYSAFLWKTQSPLPTDVKELVGAVINVSGVALAFIATLQGFLFSMQESLIVQRLRQLGAYDSLLRYFTSAIHYCLLLIIVSACSYFEKFAEASDLKHKIAFTAWIFLCGLTMGACYRIIIVFQGVLRRHRS